MNWAQIRFWKVRLLINTVALARWKTRPTTAEPFQRFLASCHEAVETAGKLCMFLVHRAKATVLMRDVQKQIRAV